MTYDEDGLLEAWREEHGADRDAEWRRVIPRRFWSASLSDFEGSAAEALRAWSEAPSGNLILFGPVDTSKTHAAVAVARRAFDSGRSVGFHPVCELFDALREANRPGSAVDPMPGLVATDVLILDDLGVERPTEYTVERLFVLVNRRWMDERPIVVTSNLPVEDLKAGVGLRVWSRLSDGATPIALRGEPHRRPRRP